MCRISFFILIIIFLLIFIFCFQCVYAKNDLKEIIKGIKPSVVKVICKDLNLVGSGFLISSNGYIVTSHHIVSKINFNKKNNSISIDYSKEIIIKFYDGSTKSAQIAHIKEISDRPEPLYYDFAILKIQDSNLPFLELSDENNFEEGEQVLFCGYPFGLDNHTTHIGILSSIFIRQTDIKGIEQNVLQIDGSINKGNSGGPLLDIKSKKVIGVISTREGRLTCNLEKVKNYISEQLSKSGGSVYIQGVNPIPVILDLIEVLDRNISVGIGHAISSKYVLNYLKELNFVLEK